MVLRLGTQLQPTGLEQSINSGLVAGGFFAGASLDLNFAADKNVDPLVTFTRASSGTYVGSDGVLRTATTNEPRFDHNPTTGESLGLLVEEQRTNSIRNNTMVGAVAGTPGTLPTNWNGNGSANGITREIIGTGIEDGIPYVDVRYSGTNTSGSTYFNSIAFEEPAVAAAQNQTWTESSYFRLLSGAVSGAGFSNGLFLTLFGTPSFNDNGSMSLASITGAKLSSQRFTLTKTFTNATTTGASARITFTVATGGTIDFTLRIGLPQLEQGAFATSVIPTSGTAVTRSADVVSITGTNFSSWYRQDEGTVFADINTAPVANIAQGIFDLSEGAGAERIFHRRNTTSFIVTAITDNSVVQGDFGSVSVSASGRARLGLAYRLNDFEAAVNGSSSGTDTSATVPTPDRIHIGQNFASGQSVNGTIRRLVYWGQRLPNSVLQTITQ